MGLYGNNKAEDYVFPLFKTHTRTDIHYSPSPAVPLLLLCKSQQHSSLLDVNQYPPPYSCPPNPIGIYREREKERVREG